jgi:hypothetical protein
LDVEYGGELKIEHVGRIVPAIEDKWLRNVYLLGI